MIALLDTNILIASDSDDEMPASLSDFDDLQVSSLSWAELTKGLHTTADLATFKRRSARLSALRDAFGEGVPFDDRCAVAYDRVLGHLTAQGISPRAHAFDRMLAATALAYDLTLVSRDRDMFLGLTDLVSIEQR